MTAVRTSQRTAVRSASAAPNRLPGRTTPVRPQLAIAKAPRTRTTNWLIAGLAGGVLLVAVLAISVSQALQVQTQDRLDGLQTQIVVQQQLAEAQRLELAELQSPGRIVGTATGRLGMVPPSEIVYLRSDSGDDNLIAAGPDESVDTPAAVEVGE